MQPSSFPEHSNKSRLGLPTNLLNFKKIINYIPPRFRHFSHVFPCNEIRLCFSSPCADVNGCKLLVLPYNEAWEEEAGGGTVPKSVTSVRSVSWHCGRMQWGLKGMWEDMLGPRGGTGKGASSSWQIACLCGSLCPYIAFPLVPMSPRLVFHPCPSGCNRVPGCLDGWRCGHY